MGEEGWGGGGGYGLNKHEDGHKSARVRRCIFYIF